MGYAVKVVGSEPFIYSSDFPHEVTAEMCKEEISEVVESDALTTADKEAILHKNSVRLYKLSESYT
jgi:predicted TIM-barrel fold metal-dependent hydrolase